MFTVSIDTDLRPLENLKRSLTSKILRKAITQASKVVRDAVRENAQAVARYGFLAKSIGVRIRMKNGTAIAIVGPRTRWQRSMGTVTRGKHKGEERLQKPSKYAHFIERGTKRSKARPVLKPALGPAQGQFLQVLAAAIQQGIEDTLRKS
jgi:HK97 gp10 family phage protein